MIHRVSFVEHWRKWKDADDATLADLFHNPESEAMAAGTAFHKALELAADGEYTELQAHGYLFTIPENIVVEAAPVRELRCFKTYSVDGLPVTITGQVDQMAGLRIDDHKTTGRFDPDRYLSGYQWRLYLDIFGADVFRWNVFEIDEVDFKTYAVRGSHRLEQYRYPDLGKDCQSLIEDFARFMRSEAVQTFQKAA